MDTMNSKNIRKRKNSYKNNKNEKFSYMSFTRATKKKKNL